jgi:hypothetical protein
MANPNDPNARQISRSSDAGPEAARGPNAGSRPDFEQGSERVQTDDAPGHEQRSFQTPPGAEADDPPEDRYDPSAVEATREREQGLGMGQRDLERQRDPHRPAAPPEEESRPDGE